MKPRFQSLHALVTGTSKGIGKEIYRQLRSSGVRVTAPTRSELDLGNPLSVQAWMLQKVQKDPDILILSAGINEPAPLTITSLAVWRKTFEVNLTSTFQLIRHYGSRMARRKMGRIVVLSSILAQRARKGRAAYSASKAALEMLARSAALEYAGRGVLVNIVAPGFIQTEMTFRNNTPSQIRNVKSRIPLGRLGTVREVARWVLLLSSPENTYMTGQTIVVDGGYTLE